MDGGFADYITKPFDVRNVLSILRSLADSPIGIPSSSSEAEPGISSGKAAVFPASGTLDGKTVRMLEQGESDGEFVKNLVRVFARDSEKRLESMEAALAEGDSGSYRDAAHALKGMAGSIGALRIVELAESAQHLPESASTEEKRSYCGKLRSGLNRVKDALTRRYDAAL